MLTTNSHTCTQKSTRKFDISRNSSIFVLDLKNIKAMQVISAREFRANQRKYFELAEQETVFVTRKNKAPIAIYVPAEDDFLSKKELEAINQGLKDIQEGRTYRMLPGESLEEFLSRTEEKAHV